MKEELKNKIAKIVSDYITLYNEEFELFKKAISEKRKTQKNSYASTKGSHVVEVHLLEYPENLDVMLINKLTTDEWKEFQTNDNARWFARRFPVFCIPEKV